MYNCACGFEEKEDVIGLDIWVPFAAGLIGVSFRNRRYLFVIYCISCPVIFLKENADIKI